MPITAADFRIGAVCHVPARAGGSPTIGRVEMSRVGRLLADDGARGRSLAAIVAVAAWVATWRPQVDPDAWWHIALGEVITRGDGIPAVETASWLTAGDRLVVHSWAWDVLIATAYQWLGATGTSLLALPVTATVVLLLWWLIGTVAPSTPPLVRSGLILAAVIAALPAWAPRAQTLDLAFVLATVLVLARYLRSGQRRGLIAMPFIGLLWANLHGSAILALVACVSLAVIALPIGARLAHWPRRSIGPMIAAGLAGIAGTAFNPYGPGLLVYPFDRAVASAFTTDIVEWRPPDLASIGFLPLVVLLAAATWLFISTHRGRPDAFVSITTAAWTIAALISARFVALAACLLVVAIAPALMARVVTRVPARSGAPSTALEATDDGPSRILIAVVTAVAVSAIQLVGWTLIAPTAQDAAIRHRLPVAAVDALLVGGCRGRMLADYGWGGYITWATDIEIGAYGQSAERAVREQVAIERVASDPAPWLADHDVELVMVPVDGPLSRWLDTATGWTERYRDAQATIHVRDVVIGCGIAR